MPALADLINLYVFPTGRRLFAHRGVKAEAQALGLDTLVEHIDRAIAHDERTRQVELGWERSKHDTVSPDAVRLDVDLDRVLGNLYGLAQVHAASPVEDAKKEAATELLREVFPGGITALTQLTHEEEASALEVVIGRLQGDLAPQVERIGAGAHVERIATLVTELLEVLSRPRRDDGPTFDEVRQRQKKGQSLLLETVARVLGAFPSDKADDTKKRARLLGPILHQNEDIRAARRRRRPALDVDPQTGEVLPEPATEDAERAPEPVDA